MESPRGKGGKPPLRTVDSDFTEDATRGEEAADDEEEEEGLEGGCFARGSLFFSSSVSC